MSSSSRRSSNFSTCDITDWGAMRCGYVLAWVCIWCEGLVGVCVGVYVYVCVVFGLCVGPFSILLSSYNSDLFPVFLTSSASAKWLLQQLRKNHQALIRKQT
jgi:hypothetical protein